jgi:hypothetical protein
MAPEEIIDALNKYFEELGQILGRFSHTRTGIHIEPQDNYRFRTIVMEVLDLLRDHVPGSRQHIQLVSGAYNEGLNNIYHSASYASVEEVKSVISAVLTRIERNKNLFAAAIGPVSIAESERKLVDALDQLILRFHAVAVQLRSRHDERATLDVDDEYDVQDLMHALLRLHFDDVRPEEWVPSYAGSASRTDFLLPEILTVVELKKTRKGLNARSVGEQLIIDIAKYKKHPQCKRLVCFVYDPEGRIANPVGIENDLASGGEGIDVRVFILPKATS